MEGNICGAETRNTGAEHRRCSSRLSARRRTRNTGMRAEPTRWDSMDSRAIWSLLWRHRRERASGLFSPPQRRPMRNIRSGSGCTSDICWTKMKFPFTGRWTTLMRSRCIFPSAHIRHFCARSTGNRIRRGIVSGSEILPTDCIITATRRTAWQS